MSAAELEFWPAEEEYEAPPPRTSHVRSSSLATVAYPVTTMPAQRVVEPQNAYGRRWKRALDVALAFPLLLAAIPVILVLSLMVGLTSGTPVFYSTNRIGLNGREFRMWKLRTMVKDAEQVLEGWRETDPDLANAYFENYKLKEDPRITPLGRFLRKSSLDELPQLWNVLRGEMSLVGPRPIVKDELVHYGASVDDFLAVRPGVTGLWQTDGRNEILYPERSWFELTYCRTYNLGMDLKILARTLAIPLRLNG